MDSIWTFYSSKLILYVCLCYEWLFSGLQEHVLLRVQSMFEFTLFCERYCQKFYFSGFYLEWSFCHCWQELCGIERNRWWDLHLKWSQFISGLFSCLKAMFERNYRIPVSILWTVFPIHLLWYILFKLVSTHNYASLIFHAAQLFEQFISKYYFI